MIIQFLFILLVIMLMYLLYKFSSSIILLFGFLIDKFKKGIKCLMLS